jgi:ABC-type glycerol-3-phosphate transport system permease component
VGCIQKEYNKVGVIMLNNYKFTTSVMRFFIYLVLFFILILIIVPIWLLLVNATRSTVEIQQGLSMLPSTHLVDNYQVLLNRGLNITRGFTNSFYVAALSTLATVYFSMLTAYGIVVYEFKGKRLFTNFILVLVMIPMQLTIIGFFQYMSKLGLTDNYASLILPSIASAGGVFFSKQYFESMLIQDLIDAARIDGAGELKIFHTIMMPLAVPGAVTLGIFAFVASWNNFFNSFILITSLEKYTLPMLVRTLRGDMYRTEYGAIYLGLALTVIPVIILYAIFSRYIVSGIAMGAVKE